MHGFHELYGVIEQYIDGKGDTSGEGVKWLKWIKGGTGFLSLEAFRAILRQFLGSFF